MKLRAALIFKLFIRVYAVSEQVHHELPGWRLDAAGHLPDADDHGVRLRADALHLWILQSRQNRHAAGLL